MRWVDSVTKMFTVRRTAEPGDQGGMKKKLSLKLFHIQYHICITQNSRRLLLCCFVICLFYRCFVNLKEFYFRLITFSKLMSSSKHFIYSFSSSLNILYFIHHILRDLEFLQNQRLNAYIMKQMSIETN